MTKVKICGIQTLKSARVAAQSGADFIGFVFAPSKRLISIEQAKQIAASLRDTVEIVGVFVNETVESIEQITKEIGLDYVQLHGDEPAEVAKQISAKVIRAFSIDKVNPALLATYPCDYFLIDSPPETYRGGSGKTFDWNLLDRIQIPRDKVILAGGLTKENVITAINQVQPLAVDVSSGVETAGTKDQLKIKQFIQTVKQARANEEMKS